MQRPWSSVLRIKRQSIRNLEVKIKKDRRLRESDNQIFVSNVELRDLTHIVVGLFDSWCISSSVSQSVWP